MKPTIIIGAGLAGYTVARELRKLDQQVPLLLITADDGGYYSKPMLSNAFAQKREPAQLLNQSATQMAAQLNANILCSTRVTSIDPETRQVHTQAGSFDYARLVLATGAQAIRLPLAGNAADEVLCVNHLSDYAILRQQLARLPGNARITLLGAGLIGCEFADDLAGAGYRVTVVDPNPVPMAALAAPALSDGLAQALRARGVSLALATTATRIERVASRLQLELADGRSLEADLVLSAVGLRVNLQLAQAAGLACGRAISVDAYGRTSAADVYALGDCAEYPLEGEASSLPYVAPLMSAARAIARTLAGTPTRIDLKPAPVIVKTPSYPLALYPAPRRFAGHGTWHALNDGQRLVCRFVDADGFVRGFGVAPHDAATRQALLNELGTSTRQLAA